MKYLDNSSPCFQAFFQNHFWFLKTLKKPIILFITRMFLPALLHWILTQILAKQCIHPGWRGAIMNWASLGGSWCLYINKIQLKLVEYFISSWQNAAASAVIQWIIELSYFNVSRKNNENSSSLESENWVHEQKGIKTPKNNAFKSAIEPAALQSATEQDDDNKSDYCKRSQQMNRYQLRSRMK